MSSILVSNPFPQLWPAGGGAAVTPFLCGIANPLIFMPPSGVGGKQKWSLLRAASPRQRVPIVWSRDAFHKGCLADNSWDHSRQACAESLGHRRFKRFSPRKQRCNFHDFRRNKRNDVKHSSAGYLPIGCSWQAVSLPSGRGRMFTVSDRRRKFVLWSVVSCAHRAFKLYSDRVNMYALTHFRTAELETFKILPTLLKLFLLSVSIFISVSFVGFLDLAKQAHLKEQNFSFPVFNVLQQYPHFLLTSAFSEFFNFSFKSFYTMSHLFNHLCNFECMLLDKTRRLLHVLLLLSKSRWCTTSSLFNGLPSISSASYTCS